MTYIPMTRARLEELRAGFGEVSPVTAELVTEIERCWAQITELQERGNKQLAIQRGVEAESNQAHAEEVLLRNECIRLRQHLETLSSFIEESHRNADDEIPVEIAEAMDNYFPPAAAEVKP